MILKGLSLLKDSDCVCVFLKTSGNRDVNCDPLEGCSYIVGYTVYGVCYTVYSNICD